MMEEREATENASATGEPKLRPYAVGWEFVRQYYTTLSENPGELRRLYSDHSLFVHNDEEAAVGQSSIAAKIAKLGWERCGTRVFTFDAHETIRDGIVIQVVGEICVNSAPNMRRFVQTFVLAPLTPKKYYVYTDIFRFVDNQGGTSSVAGTDLSATHYFAPSQAATSNGGRLEQQNVPEGKDSLMNQMSQLRLDMREPILCGGDDQASLPEGTIGFMKGAASQVPFDRQTALVDKVARRDSVGDNADPPLQAAYSTSAHFGGAQEQSAQAQQPAQQQAPLAVPPELAGPSIHIPPVSLSASDGPSSETLARPEQYNQPANQQFIHPPLTYANRVKGMSVHLPQQMIYPNTGGHVFLAPMSQQYQPAYQMMPANITMQNPQWRGPMQSQTYSVQSYQQVQPMHGNDYVVGAVSIHERRSSPAAGTDYGYQGSGGRGDGRSYEHSDERSVCLKNFPAGLDEAALKTLLKNATNCDVHVRGWRKYQTGGTIAFAQFPSAEGAQELLRKGRLEHENVSILVEKIKSRYPNDSHGGQFSGQPRHMGHSDAAHRGGRGEGNFQRGGNYCGDGPGGGRFRQYGGGGQDRRPARGGDNN